MKQYEVRLAAAAYEDLDVISAYITYTLQEPLTAARLLARLQEQILSLETLPARHQLLTRQPEKDVELRQFPVGNYMIYYYFTEEPAVVYVTRILPGGYTDYTKFM